MSTKIILSNEPMMGNICYAIIKYISENISNGNIKCNKIITKKIGKECFMLPESNEKIEINYNDELIKFTQGDTLTLSGNENAIKQLIINELNKNISVKNQFMNKENDKLFKYIMNVQLIENEICIGHTLFRYNDKNFCQEHEKSKRDFNRRHGCRKYHLNIDNEKYYKFYDYLVNEYIKASIEILES